MEYELNSNAAFEYKTVLNKLYYGETYPLNRKKLNKKIQKSARKTKPLKIFFNSVLRRLHNES